jgi:ribonucleoside-diphosphate reductase alpha chain
LGKALTNVLLAKGERDIFTAENRAWVVKIVRELVGTLSDQARRQSPLRLSLNGLYELIEKTLVDNNAYDVAKSLLLNRSHKLAIERPSSATSHIRVIRRNHQVVPFVEQKIEIAVRKSFLSLRRDSAPAVAITQAVAARVHASKQTFVHIEEIQDMVQEELMKAGHFKVAEAYILYRAERAVTRDTGAGTGAAAEAGEDTTGVDAAFRSILHHAATGGHVDVTKWGLSKSIAVDGRDRVGATPLLLAVP